MNAEHLKKSKVLELNEFSYHKHTRVVVTRLRNRTSPAIQEHSWYSLPVTRSLSITTCHTSKTINYVFPAWTLCWSVQCVLSCVGSFAQCYVCEITVLRGAVVHSFPLAMVWSLLLLMTVFIDSSLRPLQEDACSLCLFALHTFL